jgi:hypothetical protein
VKAGAVKAVAARAAVVARAADSAAPTVRVHVAAAGVKVAAMVVVKTVGTTTATVTDPALWLSRQP